MFPEDHISRWSGGQGLWAAVPPEQWNDWRWQLRHRITDEAGLSALMELTPEERAGIRAAKNRLAFAVTPHFFNLIDRENPNCPIRRQVIPHAAEGASDPFERDDPIGEEDSTVVPGLVRRYPDRVLLLVTDRCAAYCRYCTRARLVSSARGRCFSPDIEGALAYIAAHGEIRDVLVSGGDALLLSEARLDALLSRLRAVPHVECVRIGTRAPVFLPQRVNGALCAVLRKHAPVWVNIHVNHPKECTLAMREACLRLTAAGAVLGGQTVLLKGINDSAQVQRSLAHRLLQMGVRPYYLYQCDLIRGSRHFRTDVRAGVEIIRQLRGFTTGLAVPQFVVDAPGGGGKVPLNPDYVERDDAEGTLLRNGRGHAYFYPRG